MQINVFTRNNIAAMRFNVATAPSKILAMRMTIVVMLLILLCKPTTAQFISSGKIEYERKTNQFAFMNENSVWDEMAKKTLSKFVTFYYDLSFNAHESLFKGGREPEVPQNKYWGVFDAENIVYHNADSNGALIQKSLFGDTYLIRDSIRRIDWRIGSEIRTIAGFACRKAVGSVLDSIIVIAFYAEDIIGSAGPESFAGLPGMILGLAVPKLHTTWYATKVVATPPGPSELSAPKKGKKLRALDFSTRLNDIMKNYGPEAKRIQWQSLL